MDTSGLGSSDGAPTGGQSADATADALVLTDGGTVTPDDASTDAAGDAMQDVTDAGSDVVDGGNDSGASDGGSADLPLGAPCRADGDCASGHCEKEILASFTTLICCRVDCAGADELHEGCFSDGSDCEF